MNRKERRHPFSERRVLYQQDILNLMFESRSVQADIEEAFEEFLNADGERWTTWEWSALSDLDPLFARS